MKATLLLTGRTADKRFAALIEEYSARICHYLPFDIQVIPELKATKNLSEEQQKTAEGELILKALTSADYVVLLDEHGQQYRSAEFAAWMQECMNRGTRRVVFVIGGPYGFSPAVHQRADHKVSLSRMTFSHQMVRLIFIEQLYRAMTILRGEPYHHE